MTGEEKELYARARELAGRMQDQGIYTRTHFLTEGERSFLSTAPLPARPHFCGGFEEAERCVALFGSVEELGYEWESDLVLLKIEPAMQKYADALTHRDVLGAVMNLGVRRDALGDILLQDNIAYLFALEGAARLLCQELVRVRHTTVKTAPIQCLPQGAGPKLEEREVVAAAPRLDALLAAVWNLSRSQAKELVEKGAVTVFGAAVTSPAREIKAGERISVRGYGRFYFDGEEKKTRSGKGRMRIRLFL